VSAILVIGRTGQVARALAQRTEAEERFLGREDLDLEALDAIAPAIAAAAPDLVINAAAYTAVDKAEEEPARAHRVNAEAVGELAAAAARAGAGFLHISTDYVYAGDKPEPYTETDPVDPINAYGASKLAGERAAQAANPRSLILRTAWVYAPWGRNFARTMLGLADRDRVRVVADQQGTPTSALDIAEACRAIAPRLIAAPAGDPVWGVYHFAGCGATSWAGFAEAIFARAAARGLIAGAPEVARITTADYPTPARRPANSRLDCARFEATFARATPPWSEALDRVIAMIPAAG